MSQKGKNEGSLAATQVEVYTENPTRAPLSMRHEYRYDIVVIHRHSTSSMANITSNNASVAQRRSTRIWSRPEELIYQSIYRMLVPEVAAAQLNG